MELGESVVETEDKGEIFVHDRFLFAAGLDDRWSANKTG